jgi:hypothetical protein
MKNFLVISLVVLLTGCASLKEKFCADAIVPEKTVQIDPRALEECKELVLLPANNPTFEGVLVNTSANAVIYAECKNKQHDSILLIKKFANIKE